MKSLALARHALGIGGLLILLWPLAYAAWLSFTPGELLVPPREEWSLRWYRLFSTSPQWTAGLGNSLEVAALSIAIALPAGVCLALTVTRYHFRGRRLLSGAVLLPLFVPACSACGERDYRWRPGTACGACPSCSS